MTLTKSQKEQIIEAIDSHVYWQLSDHLYRANGAVLEPGSDDPEVVREILAYQALQDALNDAVAADR